jgi:hypothetical protein
LPDDLSSQWPSFDPPLGSSSLLSSGIPPALLDGGFAAADELSGLPLESLAADEFWAGFGNAAFLDVQLQDFGAGGNPAPAAAPTTMSAPIDAFGGGDKGMICSSLCDFDVGPNTSTAISPSLLTVDPSSSSTSQGNSPDALPFPTSTPTTTTTNSTPSSAATIHPGLALPRQPKRSLDSTESLSRKQRNNLAAHKYRQKKIDRIAELETKVESLARERDDLRIRLARQEAETATLRELLRMRPSS